MHRGMRVEGARRLALAAACALGTLFPSSAFAGWSGAADITNGNGSARLGGVAVGTDGTVHLGQTGNGPPDYSGFTAQAHSLESDGTVTPLKSFGEWGGPSPIPQTDGSVRYVWNDIGGVFGQPKPPRTAVIAANGAVGPVSNLTSSVVQLDVQPLPDGSAMALVSSGSSFGFAKLSAAGTLGPVTNVWTETSGYVNGIAWSTAPNGAATIAWTGFTGPLNNLVSNLFAQQYSAAGVLGTRHTLASDANVGHPGIDVAADGSALVAWQHNTDQASHFGVEYKRLTAAGALGIGGEVASGDSNADVGAAPAIALASSGNAVAAWTKTSYFGDPGASSDLQARSISSAGTLGTVRDLGPTDVRGGQPAASMDSGGIATVGRVTSAGSGGGLIGLYRILGDGTVGPTLEAPAAGSAGGLLQLVGGGSTTTAVWQSSHGSYPVLAAARFSTPTQQANLSLSKSPKTATAKLGKSVKFKLTAANAGDWPAGLVELCPASNSAALKAGKCAREKLLGVGDGQTASLSAKLTNKAKAGKSYSLTLSAQGPGVETASLNAKVKVAKKKKKKHR